jgi:ABC-type phosphate transport system substrate-binding protein
MKKFVILTAILMGSILFPSLCPVPKVSEGNLVIIVNKDNPISALSASEAKLYYLRKLKNRWPGINKNIRPVTRNTKCSERDAFYG